MLSETFKSLTAIVGKTDSIFDSVISFERLVDGVFELNLFADLIRNSFGGGLFSFSGFETGLIVSVFKIPMMVKRV